MYKYLLQSVEGVQWFGIVALLLFFGVFCAAVLWVFLSKKSRWDAQARLPLEE